MGFYRAIALFIGIFMAAFLFFYGGSLFEALQYSAIMWVIALMIKR
ncbi:MAG TPA: hypothetical protein VNS08_02455 [Ureibacillus sp.]|nr:hypothetical protein [Ureibacillus sp.]